MKKALFVISITVAALWASASTTLAAEPASGTLSDPGAQVRWDDGGDVRSVAPDTYTGLLPEACSVTSCDEFRLTVALPPDVWSSNPGDGLKIGIHWIHEEDAEFNLYVYGPDAKLAAKSDWVVASDGESVLIKKPQNGDYRVVVTNVFWDGGCGHDASGECGSEPIPPQYDGLAEVYRAPAIQPLRDLLPNLIPLPTETVTLRIGSYYGDPENVVQDGTYADNAPSCYPEEMAPVDVVATGDLSGSVNQQEGARRCLRFDQIIGNTGDGPLVLRYRMEGTGTDQRVLQRIYRSDGSFYHVYTGESYTFHPTHAHFHYKNMAQTSLWPADANGRKIGDKPLRISKHVRCPEDAAADDPCQPRYGHKNSFCLVDGKYFWFGRRRDEARRFGFPDSCNIPSEQSAGATYLVNGISVGWADRYPWSLASGFVEVSGIPDGYYVLHTVVDPNSTIPEVNERDNSLDVPIWICGDQTALASKAPKPC
jgi:hypothetical protein